MKIISVVGARPNFMKIAPFCHAIEEYNKTADEKIEHLLVHTGQHYDDKMSKAFFEALNIPQADINLSIGSGSHAEQVGRTMIEFEKVVWEHKPDWVIVVGDVNATCACTITAKKEHIKCAHIEAGLRSRDMTMPEEINRLVTDRLADMLFTPDIMANENLRAEGVPEEKIKFVGNIMIDTLEAQKDIAAKLDLNTILEKNLLDIASKTNCILEDNKFAVITMHRPSNVDEKEILEPIINFLASEVASEMPLVWPIHPRTRKQLKEFGLWEGVVECNNLILLSPLGYHDLLRLNMGARFMLTDSGGLQEECCVLGTPCLTLRWNTERPVTLRKNSGASVLVGNNIERIRKAYQETLTSSRTPQRPELWDGQTAKRIVSILAE
jgi:UDP-N-acetylglucosamine 2-epimerase (non-hydrolysing)